VRKNTIPVDHEKIMVHKQKFINELKQLPIAVLTDKSAEQHYEVPTEFYLASLGKRLKYSCAYYPPGCDSLDKAEEAMLDIYVRRAEIVDGLTVLDLGCGWGSLSLYLVERFPNIKVISASHSRTQKEFIEMRRNNLGVSADRLSVITGDINVLQLPENTFDRVISIEMFEHMKNYESLLQKVSKSMKAGAKLFVHIFVHKYHPYHFIVENESDWMSKYFFSGGTMPSEDLLLYFQRDLKIQNHWTVNGVHYQKTAEDWLKLLDKNESSVRKLFAKTYGDHATTLWLVRWRLFYMSCAELFGYDNGNEWYVSHYLFAKN
jgi:cyclopropane-fatty-acyl-phospholipid synthase